MSGIKFKSNVKNVCHSEYKKPNKKSRFIRSGKSSGRRSQGRIQAGYVQGSNIEQEQYSYFVNILDAMQYSESLEDKATMANNVFEQTVDQEIHLASNKIASKVVENLIGFAEPEHFERFMNSFGENYRPICSDAFASHVLQKMLAICFLRVIYYKKDLNEENETSKESKKKKKEEVKKKNKLHSIPEEIYNMEQDFSPTHRDKCSQFILRTGRFLLNNLEEFVWDPYGSHIIRTCVLLLAGIYTSKVSHETNYQFERHDNVSEVPVYWADVVKEYANRLQMWPQFANLPFETLGSLLLGHILLALKAIDKSMLKHFGKKILIDSFSALDDNTKKSFGISNSDGNTCETSNDVAFALPKVFSRESSIRLLETLLTLAGPKLFDKLNAILFRGRLGTLALNRKTNFAVQKLIENIKWQAEFDLVSTELFSRIEELLNIGHTGVVTALSSCCLRLSTNQNAFTSALWTALHVPHATENLSAFVMCVLKLKIYEVASDNNQLVSNIHLHGSLILQNMLQFNKPIKIVQCLLAVSVHDLATIFSSPNGSYIADAFIKSKTIGEKSREKLLNHLEGSYLEMATTKFGSRVVENLFITANEKRKISIVKELSEKTNQLNSTMFGRLLFQKLRVDTFTRIRSVTQWKTSLNKANKADKFFAGIIS